jgi:hypothetical protein
MLPVLAANHGDPKTMWRDPIVAEVRRIREEYAARFGNDISAICRAAREQQQHSQHEIVMLALEAAKFETKPENQPGA